MSIHFKLLTYGLEIDFQLRCDINDSYAVTSFNY